MQRVILVDPYRWSKRRERIYLAFRRFLRHKIFLAIEQADDGAALRLANDRVLRRSLNEFGQSPLVAAMASERTDLARELIALGGTYPGDGSLALAAMLGHADLAGQLLTAGKNPNEPVLAVDPTTPDYTPLMWAVNRKQLAVLKLLLSHGADVNAVSTDGTTAVMLTAKGGPEDLQALDILCAHGPEIQRKDWRGRNIVREAKDRERNSGKPEMRQILERHFPDLNFLTP